MFWYLEGPFLSHFCIGMFLLFDILDYFDIFVFFRKNYSMLFEILEKSQIIMDILRSLIIHSKFLRPLVLIEIKKRY